MRNAWLLLKVQLADLIGLNRIVHRDRHTGKLAMWILTALVVAIFLPFSLAAYFYLMASGMQMLGQLNLFPAAILASTSLVVLLTTIAKVNGILFGFRDYDMVMSLPVSLGAVAASRVLLLYIMDLGFTVMLMVPAGGIYAWLARPTAEFYPIYVLTMLVAPLMPVVLGSLLGALISRITAGFHAMRYVRLALLTAATLGFMVFSMAAPEQSGQQLTDIGGLLGNAIQRIYPPARLYTAAVVDKNWMAAAGFIAASVLAFVAFAWILGLTLRAVNTRLSSVRAGGRYDVRQLKQSSPLMTLFVKEMKRYFASTIYVFNTAFGSLLMLMGAIALKVIDVNTLLQTISIVPQIGNKIGVLLAFAMAIIATTVDITGSSISLEGRNVWILKSLPVSAFTLLMAKLMVTLAMVVPAILLSTIIAAMAIPLTIPEIAIMLVLPCLYAMLIALVGLLFNLKWHRFDWANETVVVKQSMGALVPLLIGMALGIGPLMLYLNYSQLPIEWLTAALIAALDGGMLLLISRKGDALVRAL